MNEETVIDTPIKQATLSVAEWLNLDPSMVWITQIFVVIFFTLVASFTANRAMQRASGISWIGPSQSMSASTGWRTASWPSR